jgi:hypothetical protein
MANAPSKVVKSVNRWTPNPAPSSNEKLSDYLFHELNRLSDVIFNIDVMRLEKTHRDPSDNNGKPRDGDIRYSDGSDWNAGQGKNLYYFDGTNWIAFAGGSGSGSYAEFFDTSQQTVASVNTAYPITWNGTDVTDGVSLNVSDTSKMEFTYSGVYNIDMSATIHSTSASSKDVWIWPRIDGVDVANSSSMVNSLDTNDHRQTINRSGLFSITSGQYLQWMWATNDLNLDLHGTAASAFGPAVPSATVTIVQVDQ